MENRKEWRRSISLTEDMEKAIVEMRKDDRFTRLSYSEIIRQLLQMGLQKMAEEQRAEA